MNVQKQYLLNGKRKKVSVSKIISHWNNVTRSVSRFYVCMAAATKEQVENGSEEEEIYLDASNKKYSIWEG